MVGPSGAAAGDVRPRADSRLRLPAQAIGPSRSDPSAPGRGDGRAPLAGGLLLPVSRLIIYGGVFLLGYFLANIFSAWEHQRFVESVLASNGFVAVLRLGLSDELDRLNGDLAALVRPLEAVRSSGGKADESLAEVGAQLASAARRIMTIKAQYGNTPAEDDMLRRLLRDKLTRATQAPPQSRSAGPESKPGASAGHAIGSVGRRQDV